MDMAKATERAALTPGEAEALAADGAASVAEAAKFLSVGRSQIYELMDSGKLRSFKIGGRRLIARQELRRYLAACMAGGTPADPGDDLDDDDGEGG